MSVGLGTAHLSNDNDEPIPGNVWIFGSVGCDMILVAKLCCSDERVRLVRRCLWRGETVDKRRRNVLGPLYATLDSPRTFD